MTQNELYHYCVLGMKWGHRKNYYGKSGNKYVARNGVTVGAPKNARVAAFRKFQGTKIGAAIATAASLLYSNKDVLAYHAKKYATEKARQKANKGLARIGTMKLKHVGKNVYEWRM